MVFACQLDSFRTKLTTKVTSCKKVESGDYEVICEDTILFPEGGGQPFDTGFLNDIPVHQVLRRGPDAIHYVKTPFELGCQVDQSIDWERRLDHMQQHSGQHLITAVINAEYKIDTTSWWLGADVSHIELDTTTLTQQQINHIEKISNEKITQQIPVQVKLYDLGDPALNEAHCRGLPEDVTGPIRVVEIVGMEYNMCCGTHVTNLIQLQAVKLLYTEKGKKNKINLFFLSGGRVLKYFSNALQREQKLTKLLKSEPSQHVDLVEKLQINAKMTSKKLSIVLKQLANLEAKAFIEMCPRPLYFIHHCKEGDQEYVEAFLRAVRGDPDIENTLVVLIVGEEKGPGNLVVYGEDKLVAQVGQKLADVLGGKGAAHGPKFQAKITKLTNLKEVKKLLSSTFENISASEQ